jgi:hypothetical protein
LSNERGMPVMKGFHSNIEKLTLENETYRKVLYTGRDTSMLIVARKGEPDHGLYI